MPADARRLTLLLGAFGDPGHAFPIIALGTELAARGHRVVVDTWKRWRTDVEAGGMEFVAAPEYQVFPTRERPLKPYEAAVRAARETLPRVQALGADAVVSDILTPAPALAGELAGLPVATLIPHIDPRFREGWPPFSIGARLPRTRAGRSLWRRLEPMTAKGLEQLR
ncbi:MAG: glycosyltransferase, partial [Solirubrobacteraceae bacterium]